MTIAIWIIAICEAIRLIQNTLQLLMMNFERKNPQMKRATDAFIKSLNKTDSEFMEQMLVQLKEKKNG